MQLIITDSRNCVFPLDNRTDVVSSAHNTYNNLVFWSFNTYFCSSRKIQVNM